MYFNARFASVTCPAYSCTIGRYTQGQIEEYKQKSTEETSAAPAEAADKADFDEWADAFNKAGELHMTRMEDTKSLFDSRAVDGQ